MNVDQGTFKSIFQSFDLSTLENDAKEFEAGLSYIQDVD